MESKNGTSAPSTRTSARLRSKTTYYSKGFVYYQSPMRKKVKSKKRTAAAQIAKKILTPRKSFSRNVPTDSNNLRRSTRKRKVSTNLEGYTDTSSSEDDDLMTPGYRPSKNKSVNNSNHSEVSTYPSRKNKRLSNSNSAPRREGLRPRRAPGGRLLRHYGESEDEAQDDDNDDDDDDDDDEEEEEEGEGDSNGENGNEEEEEEAEGGDEAEEEEEEDDDEQEGRRRYDLRDRSEVRRSSPIKGEKQRERAPHSPRRVLHHGMGLAGPRNGR